MEKSTISMAIFNSYFDITRGYIFHCDLLNFQGEVPKVSHVFPPAAAAAPRAVPRPWASRAAKAPGAAPAGQPAARGARRTTSPPEDPHLPVAIIIDIYYIV